MARRTSRGGFSAGRTKSGIKTFRENLDYHEGLSPNQVKVILRALGLDGDKFDKWMDGQTGPIISRGGKQILGVFEYDLFRWIENQKKGTPLIFD